MKKKVSESDQLDKSHSGLRSDLDSFFDRDDFSTYGELTSLIQKYEERLETMHFADKMSEIDSKKNRHSRTKGQLNAIETQSQSNVPENAQTTETKPNNPPKQNKNNNNPNKKKTEPEINLNQLELVEQQLKNIEAKLPKKH